MSCSSNDYEPSLPNLEHEINCAKAYLQQRSCDFNDSLYDHLSQLLCKILADRPKDPLAVFDEYSQKISRERFTQDTESFQTVYVPPVDYEYAKKLIQYFKTAEPIEELLLRNEAADLPDLPKLFYNFQQVGITLPQSDILFLDFSIRELPKKYPIENIRFWGKIFGTLQNYYIVEANLQDDELYRRQEILDNFGKSTNEIADGEAAEAAETNVNADGKHLDDKAEDEAEEAEEKPIPKVKPKVESVKQGKISIFEIPEERLGTGSNANVYFVCNFPGMDDWTELPSVTPQQIIISRDIACFFTGKLDAEVNSYPEFPGNEKNYLRAQIARISATTLISPVGYFMFDENDDEEEEADEAEIDEDDRDIVLKENVEYNPLLITDLLDISNWCHYSPCLLKQGRVMFWSPIDLKERGTDNDEIFKQAEGEVRLWSQLLRPLSHDSTTYGLMPWTTRQYSKTRPETSAILVRSNIWPGAFAYAAEKHFGNIYIGWGNKITTYYYVPLKPLPEAAGESVDLHEGEEEALDEYVADIYNDF